MKNVPAALLVFSVCLLTHPESGAQAGRYSRTEPVAGEPVVADSVTGLMWQGCAAGLSGSGCDSGTATPMTRQVAVAHCENLDWGGHLDWRLPEVKELGSIMDDRRASPTIDPAAFPGTPADYFWSSSLYGADSAWRVNFNVGNVNYGDKDLVYYVRCVRSGP